MTFEEVKEVVLGKQRGAFTSITWERELPVRKAYADNKVKKITSAVVRFGVEYDNIKDVQRKRENGELPAENAGLKWGEWLLAPYFIEHKGQTYLRCTESHNNTPHTRYFLNGEEVTREEVEGICTKAAFTDHKTLDVFTIKTDSVVEIR